MKKTSYLILLILLICSCATKKQLYSTEYYPKREFRGAWIQAVNGQFTGMDEEQMKEYLIGMLDNLQKVNVNAIIFQVRVEGDALYPSPYEPWSRYLTGEQGCSPGFHLSCRGSGQKARAGPGVRSWVCRAIRRSGVPRHWSLRGQVVNCFHLRPLEM